jgi:hypothetical protein
MSYRVSTQVYSGPFDLLLQLVTRQKVDIGAISISEVAEQYLAEVERIEALDLDVASDFLLVAATLLDIKAASLVPQEAPRKVDDDDDEFDEDLEELSTLDGDALREVLIQSDIGNMAGSTGDVEVIGDGLKYATMVVSTLPIMCLYPFLQKYFVAGVTIGAVKG